MQDRYAGDIGDFMKLGLLRHLISPESGLRLGVNWYLVDDEFHNADGKHVTYQDPANRFHSALRACDPDLMERLTRVVEGPRSVSALEQHETLPPATVTHAVRLDGSQGDEGRRSWHAHALLTLKAADVVFVDPDNGIRVARNTDRPEKFAFVDELADYVRRGQSLVAYHHADRSPGGVPVQVERRLDELADATGTEPIGAVVAHRSSTRFFLVVPAPDHRKRLKTAVATFVQMWTPHASFRTWSGQTNEDLLSALGHNLRS